MTTPMIPKRKPLTKLQRMALRIKHKALAFYHSKWYGISKLVLQLTILALLIYVILRGNTPQEKVYHSNIAQPIAMKKTEKKGKPFPMDEVYITLAQNMEKTHGIPTAITLAQLALESSWGKSKLMKVHNYFGHKHYTTTLEGTKGSMPAKDDCGSEDCLFQGYASRWYGFYHHGRLLKDNYKQWLQEHHDDATQAWAECLCAKEHKIGKKNYASACKNKEYTKTILSIIDTYQLTQYNINQ